MSAGKSEQGLERGVGRHQVRSPEPLAQWGSGSVQDRIGCDRGLVTAGLALPQATALKLEGGSPAAARTPISFWPTTRDQIPPARCLVRELGLDSLKLFGKSDRATPSMLHLGVFGVKRIGRSAVLIYIGHGRPSRDDFMPHRRRRITGGHAPTMYDWRPTLSLWRLPSGVLAVRRPRPLSPRSEPSGTSPPHLSSARMAAPW